MFDSIVNFFNGVIDSIVSVPQVFVREATSQNWGEALGALVSPGGFGIFIIILMVIILTGRRKHI